MMGIELETLYTTIYTGTFLFIPSSLPRLLDVIELAFHVDTKNSKEICLDIKNRGIHFIKHSCFLFLLLILKKK